MINSKYFTGDLFLKRWSQNSTTTTNESLPNLNYLKDKSFSVWNTDKSDFSFLAKYKVKVDKTMLKFVLNSWTGSWVTYIVRPGDVVPEPSDTRQLLKLAVSPNIIYFRISGSVKLDQALILLFKNNFLNKTESSLKKNCNLTLSSLGVGNNLFFPFAYLWTINAYKLEMLKRFVVATQGDVFAAQIACPLLKKVQEKLHMTFHASWISGLSIKMDHKNVSQIDFNNTSLTIQKGKYYFFKLCSYCNSKKFSWNEAQKHCEKQGGILPEILSRDDEEEIIRLIDTSSDLFLIQALFIGLKIKEPFSR